MKHLIGSRLNLSASVWKPPALAWLTYGTERQRAVKPHDNDWWIATAHLARSRQHSPSPGMTTNMYLSGIGSSVGTTVIVVFGAVDWGMPFQNLQPSSSCTK